MKTKQGIRVWRRTRLVAGLILLGALGTAEIWMLTHWQRDLQRACERQSFDWPANTAEFHFAGQ